VIEDTTASDVSNGQSLRFEPVHTLSDQAVQVLVVRALDSKVAAADVVDGLVVNHEGAVAVLEGGMCGKDGVVRLDN